MGNNAIQLTIDVLRGKISFKDYKRKKPLASLLVNLFKIKRREDFVSLGFNCEVSQRLQDAFPQGISHYLFTWTFINERNKFLDALQNLDNIEDSSYIIHKPTGMIINERFNIAFHPKNHSKADLLNEDGSYSDKVSEAIEELKSRITYLAQKTKNLDKNVKNIKFIMKLNNISPKEDIDYLRSLYNILNNLYKNFILIVVTSKEVHNDEEFEFISDYFEGNDRIKFHRIKSYAPSGDTSHGGDVNGWLKVIKQYM